MNFTEKIPEPFLEEMRKTYTKTKLIRTVVKMSDPKDTGLRMDYPLVKKKKKKKAKKKKKWEIYFTLKNNIVIFSFNITLKKYG